MAKLVKVSYNADTLSTEITVDGKPFDTSRINGKEIADWAYPFMMRKVKWNGFYDEMVEALGGEKEFDLVFEGSEEDLDELKEAWENAPVTIISEEDSENTVVIEYDENSLATEININGKPFDTSRINGKEIEDWVYPFMMRKVKWEGIFEELAKAVGSEEYAIQFSGSNSAMKELMEECPEGVEIKQTKKSEKNTSDKSSANYDIDESLKQELEANESVIYDNNSSDEDKEKAFKWLVSHENVNNPQIHFLIGKCYHKGIGTAKNFEKAMEWYTKAAEKSHTYAYDNDDIDESLKQELEANESVIYNNNSSDMDKEKAFKWLVSHENENRSQIYFLIGKCCHKGIGTVKNLEEAVKWYTKAEDRVEFVSLHFTLEIPTYWEMAKKEEKIYTELLKCYNELAEQGEAWAQNALGNHFYKGDVGRHTTSTSNVNYSSAVYWYLKALEQNFPISYYNLGTCYRYGRGVTKDKEKAKELFQKGIELGDKGCEKAYNEMMKNGQTLEMAKGIGLKFLKNSNGILGRLGNAVSETLHEQDNPSKDDSDNEY